MLPGSTITETVQQATVGTTLPDFAAGLVVTLPWSLLCQAENRCDLSIITRIADYWRARGKSIVLAVETVGYPMRLAPDDPQLTTATPDWVLRRVATYDAEVRVFGARDPRETARVAFPSYADPRFLALVAHLAATLTPLDGNPAIAELRIGLGLTTEDNPSPGGPRWLIPGFGDADWLRYSRQVIDAYRANFHRTRLEVDIGFVGLAAVRTNGRDAGALIDTMIKDRIFLAFDGLSDRTAKDLAARDPSRDWQAQDMVYLRRARDAGLSVGLESRAPLTAPDMQDVTALADAVRALGADRVVLFPFEAASLAPPTLRDAPLEDARHWIAVHPTGASFAQHVKQFISLIDVH